MERGRRDAVAQQSQIDIIRVRRSELHKLSVLLHNFLDVNPNNKIVLAQGITEVDRRTIVRNMEDIEYVLGYLKGLT